MFMAGSLRDGSAVQWAGEHAFGDLEAIDAGGDDAASIAGTFAGHGETGETGFEASRIRTCDQTTGSL